MITTHPLTEMRAKAYADAMENLDRGPIAFVAVMPDERLEGVNGALGVAVANERGYTPVPLRWARYATFDAAQEHAEALNALIGHDNDTAFRIVASTMGGRRFYPDAA